MRALLLAGLSGFMKGAMGMHTAPARGFADVVTSAATEEVAYRAIPATIAAAMGREAPRGLGALVFAADHLLDDRIHGVNRGGGLGRFADVLLGGLIYEDAYKSHGVLGAIAAHVAHNMAVQFGATRHAPKRKSPGGFGRCRPRRK